MNLKFFFNLLAAIIGLIGAIFLSKSIFKLSPKDMVLRTVGFTKIAYTREQIVPMANQKAEAIVGIIHIIISFLIQVFSLIFFQLSPESESFSIQWLFLMIAFAAIIIVVIISIFMIKRLQDCYMTEADKEANKLSTGNS